MVGCRHRSLYVPESLGRVLCVNLNVYDKRQHPLSNMSSQKVLILPPTSFGVRACRPPRWPFPYFFDPSDILHLVTPPLPLSRSPPLSMPLYTLDRRFSASTNSDFQISFSLLFWIGALAQPRFKSFLFSFAASSSAPSPPNNANFFLFLSRNRVCFCSLPCLFPVILSFCCLWFVFGRSPLQPVYTCFSRSHVLKMFGAHVPWYNHFEHNGPPDPIPTVMSSHHVFGFFHIDFGIWSLREWNHWTYPPLLALFDRSPSSPYTSPVWPTLLWWSQVQAYRACHLFLARFISAVPLSSLSERTVSSMRARCRSYPTFLLTTVYLLAELLLHSLRLMSPRPVSSPALDTISWIRNALLLSGYRSMYEDRWKHLRSRVFFRSRPGIRFWPCLQQLPVITCSTAPDKWHTHLDWHLCAVPWTVLTRSLFQSLGRQRRWFPVWRSIYFLSSACVSFSLSITVCTIFGRSGVQSPLKHDLDTSMIAHVRYSVHFGKVGCQFSRTWRRRFCHWHRFRYLWWRQLASFAFFLSCVVLFSLFVAPYGPSFENSLRGIFSHLLTQLQFYLLAIDHRHPVFAWYDTPVCWAFNHSLIPHCANRWCPCVPGRWGPTFLTYVCSYEGPPFYCLHSIFPWLFSISAFCTHFSKRKGQLLTCTTLPPLTPLFLCHGSMPF